MRIENFKPYDYSDDYYNPKKPNYMKHPDLPILDSTPKEKSILREFLSPDTNLENRSISWSNIDSLETLRPNKIYICNEGLVDSKNSVKKDVEKGINSLYIEEGEFGLRFSEQGNDYARLLHIANKLSVAPEVHFLGNSVRDILSTREILVTFLNGRNSVYYKGNLVNEGPDLTQKEKEDIDIEKISKSKGKIAQLMIDLYEAANSEDIVVGELRGSPALMLPERLLSEDSMFIPIITPEKIILCKPNSDEALDKENILRMAENYLKIVESRNFSIDECLRKHEYDIFGETTNYGVFYTLENEFYEGLERLSYENSDFLLSLMNRSIERFFPKPK